MKSSLSFLLEEIHDLEKSISKQVQQEQQEMLRKIKKLGAHKGSLRLLFDASLLNILVAPVIYSMIIPGLILDLFVSVYQAVCFPVYGIQKVRRSDYVIFDRHNLEYLNWIEKINCNYCAYFNGVIAYVREVASRTEQYFCPIKHALKIKGAHGRYSEFLEYGDGNSYEKQIAKFRAELAENSKSLQIPKKAER